MRRSGSDDTHSQRWAVWGVIFFIAAYLFVALPSFIDALRPLVGDSTSYYELIFRNNVHVSPVLVQFVRQNTPENVTLLLGSNWYPAHARYFFFPRVLIFGNEEALSQHPDIDYVVVWKDYPDFPVPGEKLMLDDERGLIKVLR
jgi:hypothetical protein